MRRRRPGPVRSVPFRYGVSGGLRLPQRWRGRGRSGGSVSAEEAEQAIGGCATLKRPNESVVTMRRLKRPNEPVVTQRRPKWPNKPLVPAAAAIASAAATTSAVTGSEGGGGRPVRVPPAPPVPPPATPAATAPGPGPAASARLRIGGESEAGSFSDDSIGDAAIRGDSGHRRPSRVRPPAHQRRSSLRRPDRR